jgi:hypothetical protein
MPSNNEIHPAAAGLFTSRRKAARRSLRAVRREHAGTARIAASKETETINYSKIRDFKKPVRSATASGDEAFGIKGQQQAASDLLISPSELRGLMKTE